MPNINGVITFKATVSIARKPKYFLGIKIHRAIVQIAWMLTTEYNDTQVVAVLDLDLSKSEYPSCETSVEYAKSSPVGN